MLQIYNIICYNNIIQLSLFLLFVQIKKAKANHFSSEKRHLILTHGFSSQAESTLRSQTRPIKTTLTLKYVETLFKRWTL